MSKCVCPWTQTNGLFITYKWAGLIIKAAASRDLLKLVFGNMLYWHAEIHRTKHQEGFPVFQAATECTFWKKATSWMAAVVISGCLIYTDLHFVLLESSDCTYL
ncbi:hypothetical protein AMECASPLE_029689 [Ameca splendens]|uniref:Uncharacterized protein n=1 Tax=Ameca splendens TaxID=208324 RepID=A0ABV0Y6D7_9TELE